MTNTEAPQPTTKKKHFRVVLFGATILILSACGSSASSTPAASSSSSSPTSVPATTTTEISQKTAGQNYLSIVAPINSALTAFGTKASQWTNQTTNSQAGADAAPVVTALQTFQQKLISSQWPGVAKSDVKSLITDTAPLIADLQSLSSTNVFNVSSWVASFAKDNQAQTTSAQLVRHDLGLPAA